VSEDDHCSVDVARHTDLGVDAHPANGVHRLDLATRDIASHVEIVDRHIVEDPTRDLDVGDGWRGRVATGDGEDLNVTNGAVDHCVCNRFVRWIEPSVESDVERHSGRLHRRQPPVDLGDIEADRFLAEDRTPGFGRRDHAVDVGVGRSADGDGVGVDREGLIECSGGRNPKFGGNRLCGLGDHVEHADDLGTGNPTVEVVGVHRTDAAAAEYNKTNGHQRVSLSLVEE